MKTIKMFVLAVFLLFGVATLASSDFVMAQTPQQVQDGVKSIGGGNSGSLEGTLKLLLNAFFMIIGALSVIMIVYSGFRYITSAGDTSAVASAKNTLLYSIIGLIIALSAYAIANFVVGTFDGEQEGGGRTSERPGTGQPDSRTPLD